MLLTRHLSSCASLTPLSQSLHAQTKPRELMQALRQWVLDEYQDKLQRNVDASTWPIKCSPCFSLCLPAKLQPEPV